MVWIFSYQQTGTVFNGINYEHPPSDQNRLDTPSISSKSNLPGTFLTSHISTMLYHIVSEASKLGQIPMVWIFFLSTNRNYFSDTESTTGIHPRFGTA